MPATPLWLAESAGPRADQRLVSDLPPEAFQALARYHRAMAERFEAHAVAHVARRRSLRAAEARIDRLGAIAASAHAQIRESTSRADAIAQAAREFSVPIDTVAAHVKRLEKRERDGRAAIIAALAAKGRSNAAIASKCRCSISTVKRALAAARKELWQRSTP